MSYKWKPSASQRREFAKNMQNPDFANQYHVRKNEKAEKRRSKSNFDYNSAGGNYIPTKAQYDFCFNNPNLFNTTEEEEAKNEILFGYSNNEKVNHDYIHIVNEKIRRF